MGDRCTDGALPGGRLLRRLECPIGAGITFGCPWADEPVEDLFAATGALLDGHFVLNSGSHADRYLEKFAVLQYPVMAVEIGRRMAAAIGGDRRRSSSGPPPVASSSPRGCSPAQAFDSSEPDSLRCTIDEWKPSLDFALRFVTGYAVRCPVGEFEGEKARLLIYLRVTPAGKSPALFGSAFHLPEISPEMRQAAGKDVRKLKNEVGMSGVLCVGEGEYSIEVLVVDDKNRRCRRRWKARIVPKRDQRDVRLAIDPLTVEPIDRSSWKLSPPSERGGLHLTIFIDAAPIYPHQPVLRAWDRAFLLECVYSVLRQTPYKSIRVVAFNLEQQREIFRDEHFDAKAFLSLSHALREIETASVSVQALKQRNSPEFLATLANKELNAPDRSDAVIFLGPHARMDVKVSDGLLAPRKPESPPFFYFEYFPFIGGDFPDAIQRLVKSADGKTFAIHSPAQFDQAIQKMLAQLKQE